MHIRFVVLFLIQIGELVLRLLERFEALGTDGLGLIECSTTWWVHMVAITGRRCCWYRKAHSKADQLFARQVTDAFDVFPRIQARENSSVLIHLRLELVDKPAIAC